MQLRVTLLLLIVTIGGCSSAQSTDKKAKSDPRADRIRNLNGDVHGSDAIEIRFDRLEATDEAIAIAKGWKEVYSLKAGYSDITDKSIPVIASLPNLKILHIHNTLISDAVVDIISEFRDLTSLRLPNGVKEKKLALLENLQNVTTLQLKNCVLGKQGMKSIVKLKLLQKLDLQGSDLRIADLPLLLKLKNLKELNISRTSLDHRAVDHIVKLKQLTHLVCVDTRMSEGDIEKGIKKHLKDTNVEYKSGEFTPFLD